MIRPAGAFPIVGALRGGLRTLACAALLLAAASGAAFAHDGHPPAGFLDGLRHPFDGLDHWLALVALGICSARERAPQAACVALAFVAALLGGALLGTSGLRPPGIETLLPASLLGLGAMVVLRVPLHARPVIALIALCALAQGLTHGHALAASAGHATLAGVLLASALIAIVGTLFARVVRRRAPWATMLAGAVAAATGATLTVALFAA